MSGGYGWLQLTLDGALPLKILLLLLPAKILATSFTISSGGSGGVFAPSLVIGGVILPDSRVGFVFDLTECLLVFDPRCLANILIFEGEFVVGRTSHDDCNFIGPFDLNGTRWIRDGFFAIFDLIDGIDVAYFPTFEDESVLCLEFDPGVLFGFGIHFSR